MVTEKHHSSLLVTFNNYVQQLGKQLFLFLSFLFLFACSEKSSTNAEECYRLWSGMKPPKEVKVLNGSYWQSSHFTKEYIMFLELEATDEWRKLMRENNKFVLAEDDWEKPSDAPVWFTPARSLQKWKRKDDYSESRYFEDTIAKKFYFYEIQL